MNSAYKIITTFFDVVEWTILIDVVLSFIPMKNNVFTQVIRTITEPLLMPGRKIQERILPGLMVDFSPVFALIMIRFLQEVILSIIL